MPCVEDTVVPVAEVLDRLARGDTEQQIVDWSGTSRHQPTGALHGSPLSREGIRAAAAYGALISRETRPSPPAEASIAEGMPEGISIEDARAWAKMILEQLAAGDSQDDILGGHPELTPALYRAAVTYAARLAWRSSPVPETAEETFLRDMLADADRDLVEDAFVYRSLFPRATPEKLFEIWKRLVEEVERGHDDFDEYTLALYRRDGLEDLVVTIVSPTSEERLRDLITPWDRRFEAATRPSNRAIFPRRWKLSRWWWHRVPVISGEAFGRRLKQLGVVPIAS